MSPETGCRIESLQSLSGVSFISIKSERQGKSELVLNPRMFPSVNPFLLGYYGYEELTETSLRLICRSCKGCHPQIRPDGDGFRVRREGYWFGEENIPLFTHHRFPSEEPGDYTRRVCVIDDVDPTGLSEFLSMRHLVESIRIDPHAQADRISVNQLLEHIRQFHPDWAVCDKGLGDVDGIELILHMKEEGIRTIMNTGEIQTRETHYVADVFLPKLTDPEDFLRVIEQ